MATPQTEFSNQLPPKDTSDGEAFSRWYVTAIRRSELADYFEAVGGTMVIRPYGYSLWENMQAALDQRFKATGHKNAYFPLFVPESFLRREAKHVEGFAPEVAWVTHAGGEELQERLAIRPTSETIFGHFYSKWIQSWRDLPVLINQWANIVRWEKRTVFFLRTTEFLWQEGHTAHSTHEEAQAEVMRMLDVYGDFAEQMMAMPVVRGIKTQSEKFAGAVQSLCIEAFMQDGKSLQAGTSHDLGQNFGKAFDVKFQNEAGVLDYVWQTSWGVSTRLIGGLVMTHSDDAGLVVPPRMSPVHAAIIPIYKNPEERSRVLAAAERISKTLGAIDIAPEGARYRDLLEVRIDDRDLRPGAKFYHWERRGVPMRIELGPKDLDKGQVCFKMRVDGPAGTGKQFVPEAEFLATAKHRFATYQDDLLAQAKARMQKGMVTLDDWSQFLEVMKGEQSAFAWCHWDGTPQTEAAIKAETKATIRCIPLPGQGPAPEPGRCIKSGAPSPQRVLIAKAY